MLTLSRVKSSLAALPFLALQAQVAFANGVFGPIPDVTGNGSTSDIRVTAINVLRTILSFLGLVAVIVIVIAGIRLIIGGADEGQREKARNAVVYAIIGLVLILLARAIVDFVYQIAV